MKLLLRGIKALFFICVHWLILATRPKPQQQRVQSELELQPAAPVHVPDFHERMVQHQQNVNRFYKQRPRPWRVR